MCIATAAIISTVVGTVVSAGGALMAGGAQSSAASYQASVARNQALVAENNAKLAEQQADYAGKVGMQNAATASLKGAARLAKIKAGFAANNIDPNTGSAVDVQVSQGEVNKLDAENVMSDAELKAYGYRSTAADERYKAQTLRSGAGFAQAQGNDALTASYFKAGGTLLSGLSPLAAKWGGGGSAADGVTAGAAPAGGYGGYEGYANTLPGFS